MTKRMQKILSLVLFGAVFFKDTSAARLRSKQVLSAPNPALGAGMGPIGVPPMNMNQNYYNAVKASQAEQQSSYQAVNSQNQNFGDFGGMYAGGFPGGMFGAPGGMYGQNSYSAINANQASRMANYEAVTASNSGLGAGMFGGYGQNYYNAVKASQADQSSSYQSVNSQNMGYGGLGGMNCGVGFPGGMYGAPTGMYGAPGGMYGQNSFSSVNANQASHMANYEATTAYNNALGGPWGGYGGQNYFNNVKASDASQQASYQAVNYGNQLGLGGGLGSSNYYNAVNANQASKQSSYESTTASSNSIPMGGYPMGGAAGACGAGYQMPPQMPPAYGAGYPGAYGGVPPMGPTC